MWGKHWKLKKIEMLLKGAGLCLSTMNERHPDKQERTGHFTNKALKNFLKISILFTAMGTQTICIFPDM